MKVLKLVEYRCRESVAILKVLLTLALEGRLRGLMLCYRLDDGTERDICTGAYRVHPHKAASASMRMSIRLMQANGEIE